MTRLHTLRCGGLCLAFLFGILGAMSEGDADPWISIDDGNYHSSQHFALELKLGPYQPNIDHEFSSGETPYRDLFGKGPGIHFGMEFDVQLWRGFGSIALGSSVTYFFKDAKACRDTGSNGAPSKTCNADDDESVRSAGDTSIHLIPISVMAIYRFDLLAEKWNIPIVPFVKAGPNVTLWWITRGDGSVAKVGNDRAQGSTWGFQLNVGGALQLDFLEPRAAKSLDTDIGINHSYLFIELVYLLSDGFGSASALNVGDTTWMAGLAFEF